MTNLIATALCLILSAENSKDSDVSSSGAVGRYQIKQCVVTDVNRIYHTAFTLKMMHQPEKAKAVAELFLKHQVKLGVRSSRTLARIWSAGRKGALQRHESHWYCRRAVVNFKTRRA